MTLGDIGNIGTAIAGAAASLALGFAFWQTREFRRHQLETTARDHYHRFLEICIQYPEYAQPLLEPALDVENRTYDGDERLFAQYEWYLSCELNALEAIYEAVGEQQSWRHNIIGMFKDHATYMRTERYDEVMRGTCSDEFQSLLDREVIRPRQDEECYASF
ncbi:MAG TPA: hypothetical protein VNU97_05000 [Rhizomicrobium sp.]|jgi:hypothetical protein|nr:hypothetical protein [Rhizomicrobium sp.]